MPPLYRDGRKRLPYLPGDRDARRFVDAMRRELVSYPDGATNDMVMSDWQAEWNMPRIRSAARREEGNRITDQKLPAYLMRQMQETALA